ncbi:phospholipase D family protein [Massilia sp. G4R7]|uniref:Phospholipase D family protein n=1 Tax=Massilia phyllostachyos TaxID=2898585 RepID=A0ABS8Q9J6_9BURK|nr:phospholipase D family protein [Massilia phyllostachyos]MCD2517280.1 phospholipase D family protein [Massilia phyllostachyos]
MKAALRRGAAVVVIAAVAVYGCSTLPPLGQRSAGVALERTESTPLGQAVAPLAAANPGRSGVHPLVDGRDAFAARVLLAHSAERSLDVQYYIWRDDLTGTLMLDVLRSAAERGVRVRLLLDDNNTGGLDPVLAALDRHPNVEVRLFNPFRMRRWRGLGYLTDFGRLNRRMHNKSFTADNQATIIGGRNIGNEYFDASGDMLFVDLDVLAVGPVVRDVSKDFDNYWNSASAYPVNTLVDAGDAEPAAALAERAAAYRVQDEAQRYLEAIVNSPFVEQLVRQQLPLEWSVTRLVSDPPDKVLGQAEPDERMAVGLRKLLGEPKQSVDLVSPYFVPSKEAAQALEDLARSGVKVRVLTNSLEATDVAAVHAGYAKWRRELIEAGVSLYELRRSWGAALPETGRGRFGSSASSLHAKTFGVDGRTVFIGSFNMDRRSIDLNTEMGFVIDSPAMAAQLSKTLRESMPERAYEVRVDGQGKLYWLERTDGKLLRHDQEPGTTFWQRAGVQVLSILPIDWLL